MANLDYMKTLLVGRDNGHITSIFGAFSNKKAKKSREIPTKATFTM